MGLEALWSANPDFNPPWQAPGLHASALELLFATDAALLGWDLMEAPGQDEYAATPLPLLDNADFERLAEECARVGSWEFLFTIAPSSSSAGRALR
jgi:hypothetical protein